MSNIFPNFQPQVINIYEPFTLKNENDTFSITFDPSGTLNETGPNFVFTDLSFSLDNFVEKINNSLNIDVSFQDDEIEQEF